MLAVCMIRWTIALFLFGFGAHSAEPNGEGGPAPAPIETEGPSPKSADADGTRESSQEPRDAICNAITSAATRYDLPLAFFTRLIWQESRFDPSAVSPKGAQGIAQFMPATANGRGVHNPFDPTEAIPKAAELLAQLRHELASIGLAAAAYNAGPGRVRDWMAGRQQLPRETRAYVSIVTGHPAEEWKASAATTATSAMPADMPCRENRHDTQTAALSNVTPLSGPPLASPHAPLPWGVQLIGSRSEAAALTAWHQLRQKYSRILGSHQPILIHTSIGGHASWHRVRIGTASLESANALCTLLRAAGATCVVQRN
jgi:hypothetical protein